MFVVIVENADTHLGEIAGVYDNPSIMADLQEIYGPPNEMITGVLAAWNVTVDGAPDVLVRVYVPSIINGKEQFETAMNHRLPLYLSRK